MGRNNRGGKERGLSRGKVQGCMSYRHTAVDIGSWKRSWGFACLPMQRLSDSLPIQISLQMTSHFFKRIAYSDSCGSLTIFFIVQCKNIPARLREWLAKRLHHSTILGWAAEDFDGVSRNLPGMFLHNSVEPKS